MSALCSYRCVLRHVGPVYLASVDGTIWIVSRERKASVGFFGFVLVDGRRAIFFHFVELLCPCELFT